MKTMVLDAFAKVVSQADTRGEYLSENQVNALIAFVKDGNKRVDVVNRLSSNSSAIVTDAARSLFSEQPVLVAPGGNAYTNCCGRNSQAQRRFPCPSGRSQRDHSRRLQFFTSRSRFLLRSSGGGSFLML